MHFKVLDTTKVAKASKDLEPIVLHFLGDSGVGKTSLIKMVATN
jgi:putative ribosome biogenesis GTPase RsgA